MRGAESSGPARVAKREAASPWRRYLADLGTFCGYVLHRFNRDGCFAASGALSYTTLVSLVPLGVIAFGILSAFPNFLDVRQEMLGLLFRNFVPEISEQASWWFQYFAGTAAQATALGIIGIAATGVLLLVTVEDQLNALWRVTNPRAWSQRVLTYWTLMTLGPLLIGMSMTLSTYLDRAARRAGLDPEAISQAANGWFSGGWSHFLVRFAPFVLELIACSLLYCVIPNCAVRWRDGLRGAVVAAAAIEILKIGFSFYISTVSSYETVYGALAAIPIFLLWMYVSWMAVLLGAVVAANLPTWRIDERLAHLGSGGLRLGFSLALIAALSRAQQRGDTCRITDLARELGVATSAIDDHLQTLATAGFVVHTQGGAWVLSWSLDTATLHDLYLGLGLPLAGTWIGRETAPWQRQIAPAMDRIVSAEAASMRVTLAAVLGDAPRQMPYAVRAVADGKPAE